MNSIHPRTKLQQRACLTRSFSSLPLPPTLPHPPNSTRNATRGTTCQPSKWWPHPPYLRASLASPSPRDIIALATPAPSRPIPPACAISLHSPRPPGLQATTLPLSGRNTRKSCPLASHTSATPPNRPRVALPSHPPAPLSHAERCTPFSPLSCCCSSPSTPLTPGAPWLEKAVGLGRKGAVGFASKGEYLGSMTRTLQPAAQVRGRHRGCQNSVRAARVDKCRRERCLFERPRFSQPRGGDQSTQGSGPSKFAKPPG